MCTCAQSLQSHLTLATPGTIICQAPLSMRFSKNTGMEPLGGYCSLVTDIKWKNFVCVSQITHTHIHTHTHTHTQLYSYHWPPLAQLHLLSSGPGCRHHNGLTGSYTHKDEQAAALNIQQSRVSLTLEDQATSRKSEAEMHQGHSTAITSGAPVRRLQAGTTLALVTADSRGELAQGV